jgi:hypothetical protein
MLNKKLFKLNSLIRVFIISGFLFTLNQVNFSQGNKSTLTRTTENAYSPNLYSDKITLQILLVNLPGVDVKGSTFQCSYKAYFIPEGEIEKLMQSKGGSIGELSASDITNKTLLNSGNFVKSSVSSNRLYEKAGILFKSKVSDNLRTMLGNIVIFYSVKIYDAKLKKNIFKDSSFSYHPFERGDTSSSRKTFNVSFFVNENGNLYTSSLPRDKTSTAW